MDNGTTEDQSPDANGGDKARARLLDAAEQLFSQQGYDGTSVRMINAMANVNSGAIHYYFGSKDELFRAVISHRGSSLGRLRREKLELACAGSTPPDIEALLRAYIEPYDDPLLGSAEERRRFARLRLRLMTDREKHGTHLSGVDMRDSNRMFLDALAAALPDLPPTTLRFRFVIMWNAVNALSARIGEPSLQAGPIPPETVEDFGSMIPDLVAQFAQFFRAPA